MVFGDVVSRAAGLRFPKSNDRFGLNAMGFRKRENGIALWNVLHTRQKEQEMDISVVVPLFNEDESLPELAAWIEKVMDGAFERAVSSFSLNR